MPAVRDGFFEWWVGMRFAVDWRALAASNNRRNHKCICRMPKSTLRVKILDLQSDWIAAHLLNGERKILKTDDPTPHWFALFEDEYGVSFKRANHKYEIARAVRKVRHEIGWLNNARIRAYVMLVWGYDPVINNLDQSPYYQNETGSQNKPALALRGESVPAVEGKSAAHSRWTALLSCCSSEDVIRKRMPFVGAMSKLKELQAVHRTCGFPSWFSVTTAPKGT